MKNHRKKIAVGEAGYLNWNCWLVKNLNYSPYKRCQFCKFRFRNCLFLHYQVISLILIFFFLGLFLLIEGTVSSLIIITIFTLVIVYGYFFNQSTGRIIEANFAQTKAKEALEELTENLEEKVDEQTKDIVEKNTRLERLLKVKSEFLDIASHQLRTPVSVICGILDMFKSGAMDSLPKDKQMKFIENAFLKGRKLNAVIDDILDASDLDEKELDLKNSLKDLDFSSLVKNIVNYSKMEAEGKRIIINTDISDNIIVKGDKKYLEQAISNIIDNAIKYTPGGKNIEIKLEKVGNKAILAVKDEGIGIPKKEQASLFKKFSRATNAKEMHTDGSGLGLFIVKNIIGAHPEGKIWFESEESKGTTFYIQLLIV
ncbi:MAG: HAMP domain-containing sensor histidine kinase [Candidatus Parcubacteria bacterium]|nr:HAMP domain-containing sensor histidine kinase [Candidatus Parcubacteria bacterium]